MKNKEKPQVSGADVSQVVKDQHIHPSSFGYPWKHGQWWPKGPRCSLQGHICYGIRVSGPQPVNRQVVTGLAANGSRKPHALEGCCNTRQPTWLPLLLSETRCPGAAAATPIIVAIFQQLGHCSFDARRSDLRRISTSPLVLHPDAGLWQAPAHKRILAAAPTWLLKNAII